MMNCGKGWGPADLPGQPLRLPCQALPVTVHPPSLCAFLPQTRLRPPHGLCPGTRSHHWGTGSVPPEPVPPWLQHIPGQRGLTPDGEDACEPLCQFRNECCL